MHRSAVTSTALSLTLVFLPLHAAASVAELSADGQLNSEQDYILAVSNENAPEEELLSVESADDSAVFIEDDVSTSLPLDPGGVFQLTAGDNQLSMTLPNEIQLDDGVLADDGSVVYTNSSNGMQDGAVASVVEEGGLLIKTVTTSSSSAREYTYEFSEDVSVEVQSTGAAAIMRRGVLIGLVEQPWSVDAEGVNVETWYTASGNKLIQHIDPVDATAYPVTSDPKVGVFVTRGDYVHVTRGQASGHGWWEKGTTKATKARVTVTLQTYNGRSWINRATGARTIKPGTSTRANARYTCRGSASTKWRSVVDVDLVGYIDTPNKVVTATRTLSCKP